MKFKTGDIVRILKVECGKEVITCQLPRDSNNVHKACRDCKAHDMEFEVFATRNSPNEIYGIKQHIKVKYPGCFVRDPIIRWIRADAFEHARDWKRI